MKSRFIDEQTVGTLKVHAVGMTAVTPCRWQEISTQTLNRWKHKYDGLERNDLTRRKALEEENAWLKWQVATHALDNQTPKRLCRKNW